MVTAQVLEATHTVEDRVLDVDNRVTGVDNHVKAIDDKVAVVIDGALFSISQQENGLTLVYLEGQETRVAVQQVADDMDQVKR